MVAPGCHTPGMTTPAGFSGEVYLDEEGDYRFRIRAKNGEIIATGEGYEHKADLLDIVTRLLGEEPKDLTEPDPGAAPETAED